ncbi:CvpA family protein [Catenovulum sp. 2E275]|uniref:CvpA family protein n=1 Tax=Catenovulum sp. 2E275 TaxID=2980497 RepID=UPI0021D230F6|nr:CvpA family protein [Catenovulum sp. 2E275]MCU4675682.1 CvpA family protein [Catenovulum sp. 2E275]
MVWIDYAIIGLISISTLVSLVRGFVREAMSLVVWIAAFFIASTFYLDFATFLTNIEDVMLRNAAAIAILFIVTIILGSIANYLISQLVQKTGLSGTDRVLGLVFGALRGVLIVAAILFFMDAFTPAASAQWWSDSVLIPEFKIVIEWFFEYMKNTSSFLKDIKPV